MLNQGVSKTLTTARWKQVAEFRNQVLACEPLVIAQRVRDLSDVCRFESCVDHVRAFLCPGGPLLGRHRTSRRTFPILGPEEPDGTVSRPDARSERLELAERFARLECGYFRGEVGRDILQPAYDVVGAEEHLVKGSLGLGVG